MIQLPRTTLWVWGWEGIVMASATLEYRSIDNHGLPTEGMLKELAQFSDEQEHAISFYFSVDQVSDSSHHEVEKQIDSLITRLEGTSASRGGGSTDTLRTLLSLKERVLADPRAFHVALFCPSSSMHIATTLPVSAKVRSLSAGYRFNLAPLVRAMQQCTPHLVVLIESDKARAFSIRGLRIEEIHGTLSSADLRVHSDDTRVGWSHHIDGNVEARSKAYWRHLSSEIAQLAAELQSSVVIGCRDSLWGHLRGEFQDSGWHLLQRFPLQRFDLTPFQVLEASRPVIEALHEERYAALEKESREHPDRAISGPQPTLCALDQARVRTLLLDRRSGGDLVECGSCGKWQPELADTCTSCHNGSLHLVPVEALLVRRALLTNAEIVSCPDASDTPCPVRAILRY